MSHRDASFDLTDIWTSRAPGPDLEFTATLTIEI
jgi:hypothetical protein